MSDRTAHQLFVDALLSLENGIDENEYAGYRRRLERRIAAESSAMPQRGRFRWNAHLAAAVLLIATGVAFTVLRQVSPGDRTASIVLSQHGDFMGKPYTDVVQASLVALVRTEAPHLRQGATVYPLRIERILKDETCRPLTNLSCEFCEKAAPGEQYLACISEKAGDWSLQTIARVDERYRREWLPGVERCVRIQAASRSADPAHIYQQLLAPEAGGVDEPACCVFACRPDPRSAEVLLARMQTFRDQLKKRIAPRPEPLPAAKEVARVAGALEDLHEPRAAGLVAQCAQLSRAGERGALYHCLPGLCRQAPPEVRKNVLRLLQEEIDNRESHPDDGRQAREALARMAHTR